MRILALALAGAAALSAPAFAAPAARQMKCPVGGATFSFTPGEPVSVYGERPDGRPYGLAKVLPLPECPGNGLVLYKDYEAEEVAKLEPLVASEAYQGLRKGDTQYYRAYWLMREMGLEPQRYLWALLQASWEADGDPELRKRYLAELAEASGKVPASLDDLNWIGMEGRAINALRELGRFDEAKARLAKVPLQKLDVKMPTGEAATPQAMAHVRTRRGWLAFFQGMKPVLERQDGSLEPVDLLPRNVALTRCAEAADKLDERGRAFCEKEAEAVEQLRLARAKAAKELDALKRSRETSGR
ncbi:MAG TPA: hypothetical protein VGB59_12320 [Allosphingosinicella sp.]|jgi:hypothetical protein